MAITPIDQSKYPVGSPADVIIGPTNLRRKGTIKGFDGQFVIVTSMVKGKNKDLRVRPGSILRG